MNMLEWTDEMEERARRLFRAGKRAQLVATPGEVTVYRRVAAPQRAIREAEAVAEAAWR